MAPKKTQTVHSKIYWLLIVIAVVLGGLGTIGIFLWIYNHATGTVRVPRLLLVLPIIILIWAARAIDGFLVERYPNLVPESKRWMLTAGAQGQEQPAGPGPAQAAPAQAPAAPGAQQAAYGHPQQAAAQPGAYPPGGGAPAPYGQPAHQPGSYQPGATQQGARQQPSAHPQDSQPGSYQPGASAPSDYGSYGTTPPATGYGYGAPS